MFIVDIRFVFFVGSLQLGKVDTKLNIPFI